MSLKKQTTGQLFNFIFRFKAKSIHAWVFAICVIMGFHSNVMGAEKNAPAVTIDNVLPFAGDESVRVDILLGNCPSAEKVSLQGKIFAAADDQDILWQGLLGTVSEDSVQKSPAVSTTIERLTPSLWSPESPVLYNLTVVAEMDGRVVAEKTVRFGFRSFEVREGRFYLNGNPIFLRGNAINPPERGIADSVSMDPQFVRDYIRYLKGQNINMVRVSGEEWMDACDELGMMQFGGGLYGVPPLCERSGPTKDVEGAVKAYQERYASVVRHPSLMVYTLSNEMSKHNPDWAPFLTSCMTLLKQWDPNRAYIGNAGFGKGLCGEIFDDHPYSGWYHGTFLDYLDDRSDHREIKLRQPWTYTECVGAYTVADGRFNVIEKQLATTLTWTGHAANQAQLALEYQAFIYKQTVELLRRLRSYNSDLAGVMPFTIMFHNWSGIKSFSDMKPKPVAEQAAVSFQPVLLSWECWTGQVYAGTELKAFAHVVNDSTDCRDIKNPEIHYWIEDAANNTHCRDKTAMESVAYYEVGSASVDIELPEDLPTGTYRLVGQVLENNEVVSQNEFRFFVAGQDWKEQGGQWAPAAAVILYDPAGETVAAFEKLRIPCTTIKDFSLLKKGQALIIGANSVDEKLIGQNEEIARFVSEGGRVLYLSQSEKMIGKFWPIQAASERKKNSTQMEAAQGGMYINPERLDHAVFQGLDRSHFRMWSDYTQWTQSQPGRPKSLPVASGLRFSANERRETGLDLDTGRPYELDYAFGGRQALQKTAVLADYGRGLSSIALCEIFEGDGSAILSAFDLVSRAGLDPVADRLLRNLVLYAANAQPHNRYPLMEGTVHWGDFADEQGMIIEKHCGLIPNVVLQDYVAGYEDDPDSKYRKRGNFTGYPGRIYLTYGRKLIGPYDYTHTCHTVDIEPEKNLVTGEFFARIKPGKTMLVTRVKNATDQTGQVMISTNGVNQDEMVSIVPGETIEVSSSIPNGSVEIHVTVAGTKGIVLLESRIQ